MEIYANYNNTITYISSSSLANNIICEDSFKKIEYKINDFIIIECNCDCSMQNNKFFL